MKVQAPSVSTITLVQKKWILWTSERSECREHSTAFDQDVLHGAYGNSRTLEAISSRWGLPHQPAGNPIGCKKDKLNTLSLRYDLDATQWRRWKEAVQDNSYSNQVQMWWVMHNEAVGEHQVSEWSHTTTTLKRKGQTDSELDQVRLLYFICFMIMDIDILDLNQILLRSLILFILFFSKCFRNGVSPIKIIQLWNIVALWMTWLPNTSADVWCDTPGVIIATPPVYIYSLKMQLAACWCVVYGTS